VLQPIIVRKLGDGYEIVAGERRWRAATRAGLREVPTIVKDLSDSHALQVALIENIQRSDLDPLEEAQTYRRLVDDHDLTHEALAEAVGKNRATITNSLRLLNLPQGVLDLLVAGKLTAGHVRPLMTLSDPKVMVRLAEEFAGRKTTVREAETRAKQAMAEITRRTRSNRSAKKAQTGEDNISSANVTEQLQRHLNTKVQVRVKGKKGSIEIFFHNFEALDDILEKILSV
jgi:ParB family chromosome partitioning protein